MKLIWNSDVSPLQITASPLNARAPSGIMFTVISATPEIEPGQPAPVMVDMW